MANIESVPHDTLGHRTGAYTYEWVGRPGDNNDEPYVVCGLAACDNKDLKTSLKVEVRVIAPAEGSFRDPFERVDFLVADVTAPPGWSIRMTAARAAARAGT